MTFRLGISFFLSSVLFILLLHTSCEVREPGCLDTRAENFDFDAVDECDSCCVLPSAFLNISYVFDTTDFSFGDTILMESGDTLMINSIQLSFSEFSFMTGSEMLFLTDTIRNEQPLVRDNYLILSSSDRLEQIGRSDFVNEVLTYTCRVGLDPGLTLGLKPFEDISDDSNFINVIEDMYVDSTSTLVQSRMVLTVADSINRDTISLDILNIENPNISVRDTVNVVLGQSWTVNMTMDMAVVIDGIEANQTNELMETTIGNNITRAIRLE